jgi:two-component system sensor histidine kinase BaeS
MGPWLRTSLGRKLFVSYVLVIVVGVVTLVVTMQLVAPPLLARHIAEALATRGRTGATARPASLDAHLSLAVRQATLEALTVAAMASLLVAAVVAVLVSRRIVQPLRRIVTATGRIAAGHYAERVPGDHGARGDEVDTLAASFNTMAGALEETERRRLALIGDLAHELRTPIATIEGYLEGVLDGVVAPSPETWARLHGEAGRLRRLVAGLQDLSRAEARQIPLILRPVAPATLVDAALDRLEGQFAAKGLALQCVVPSNLPAVQTDQDRAVQVLTNLLTNALRYTPAPGHITVTATRQDNAVVFSVADTGLGLAPEHLTRLFERFYRVDASRSRALGGSGIGLTIAKALVDAMGGAIQAQSDGLGRGSTVSVTLPIAR